MNAVKCANGPTIDSAHIREVFLPDYPHDWKFESSPSEMAAQNSQCDLIRQHETRDHNGSDLCSSPGLGVIRVLRLGCTLKIKI
jgi:hypothetical protein